MLTSRQSPFSISRRAAIARGGVLASLIAVGTPSLAHAGATPASPEPISESPNTFRLTGEGVEITYAATSFNGQPTLSYHDSESEYVFRGDQITTERDLVLGDLVSVMIETVHDAYADWVTILIPPINLPGRTEAVPLSTLAISTRRRTTVGGPGLVDGQVIAYQAIHLEGSAELLFY